MSKFLDVNKLSQKKLNELYDRGEEIYQATVSEALPVSSQETYERILNLHENEDYSLCFEICDLEEFEEDWEEELSNFYEEDYATLFLLRVSYTQDDEDEECLEEIAVVADILISENTELNNFFVHWFPEED